MNQVYAAVEFAVKRLRDFVGKLQNIDNHWKDLPCPSLALMLKDLNPVTDALNEYK